MRLWSLVKYNMHQNRYYLKISPNNQRFSGTSPIMCTTFVNKKITLYTAAQQQVAQCEERKDTAVEIIKPWTIKRLALRKGCELTMCHRLQCKISMSGSNGPIDILYWQGDLIVQKQRNGFVPNLKRGRFSKTPNSTPQNVAITND